MYFEIFSGDKLIKRGTETLQPIEFDNELMYEPTCTLTLPIEWSRYFKGREEVKIHINGRCFQGIVWGIELDKIQEIITLELRHVVSEWHYRQISVNHAMSNTALNIVYKGAKTEKNEDADETITANDISLRVSQLAKMNSQSWQDKARVYAWITSNGDRVSDISVDASKVEKKAGTYKATFKTAKGTAVTVDVTVSEDPKKGEETAPEIGNTLEPTVADKLEDIYNDKNFAYPGWQIDFQDGAESEMIDYVYSRQDKLEALTQTMELTDSLFWRVGFNNERLLEIGRFGEKKPYILSVKPAGRTNIQILEEPVIEYDFENVVNVATVYSDKSDGGMSSLTLREVYERPELQRKGFPVVILHANVNNERDYSRYTTQYPKLAPNNELEYAVLDESSIALESGTVIEGTYAYNDLNPFETDGETIPDSKRIQAARAVYLATVRKLTQARRGYNITVTTTPLPLDVNVGDQIRLVYDNMLWRMDGCSKYWQKIVRMNDWWYISRIEYATDEMGGEFNRLTLAKWLRIERETKNSR